MEPENSHFSPENDVGDSTPSFFNIVKISDTYINKSDEMKKKSPDVGTERSHMEESSSSSDSDYGKPKKKRRRKIVKKNSVHRCEYCPFSAGVVGSFMSHLAKHLADETLCKLCNDQYKSLSDLSNHIEAVHNESAIECSTCRKKFLAVEDIKFHEKISHCGDKKSACRDCGFSTSNIVSMRIHKQYHKQNQKLKCDHCSYSTFIYVSLKLHAKVHEKNFVCGYCGTNFNDVALLKKHYFLHKSDEDYFECEICPFKCVALA